MNYQILKIMTPAKSSNTPQIITKRDIAQPLLMPVEDVFSIKEMGIVIIITGRVERGIVKISDTIMALSKSFAAAISNFIACTQALTAINSHQLR